MDVAVGFVSNNQNNVYRRMGTSIAVLNTLQNNADVSNTVLRYTVMLAISAGENTITSVYNFQANR